MKTGDGVDGIDEEMYKRFVANDARRSAEDRLFGDIEEEEDLRRERLKEEKMLQSPDESLDLGQEDSPRQEEEGGTEATFTPEPLENLNKVEEKEENTASEDKTFCCKKHSKVFSQERTSIRMCATKQLYEQVSCDEPYVEEKTGAAPKEEMKAEVLTETELNAHEADIRGKLLNKRRSMNPSKV